jgi:hypothetical protein
MKVLPPLFKKIAPFIAILFTFTIIVLALDHYHQHYHHDSLKRLVSSEKNFYDGIHSSYTFAFSPMVVYHYGVGRLIGITISVALAFNDRAPPLSPYI